MRLGRIAVACAVVATTLLLPATPAAADRCQPEELVLGPGTSPVDERDNPVCVVLLQYVYPFLCSDFTTLPRCVQSLDPNTGYRPPLVPAYDPDQSRVWCRAFLFAMPSGACTQTTTTRRAVSVVGRAVVTRNANNTFNVVYSCVANALYDAVATRITACYVTSNGVSQGNSSIAVPGGMAVVADRKPAVPSGSLRLCYQSQGVFVSGGTLTNPATGAKCVAITASA